MKLRDLLTSLVAVSLIALLAACQPQQVEDPAGWDEPADEFEAPEPEEYEFPEEDFEYPEEEDEEMPW